MYTVWHEVELSALSHLFSSHWFDKKSGIQIRIRLSAGPSSNLQRHSTGSNQSTNASVQLHESTGSRHLAVCVGSLYSSLHHNVHCGAILTLWMAQSTSLWCWEPSSGKPVLTGQQLLVHHWHSHATGIRPEPKGSTGNPLHSARLMRWVHGWLMILRVCLLNKYVCFITATSLCTLILSIYFNTRSRAKDFMPILWKVLD